MGLRQGASDHMVQPEVPSVECPFPLDPGMPEDVAARQIIEGLLRGDSGVVNAASPKKQSSAPKAVEPTGVRGLEPKSAPKAWAPHDSEGHDDAATQRILQLLQGVGQPKDNPNTAKATTLEYRGQWQPKPNGAETGHGVVPKDWAIEVASENDRTLASFGWAGGAQLCLSNAFRQVDEMEAQAQDLIESGTCTEDDAAVQCIRTIAKATEEREALMRRQWCDIDFQQGEEANQELLKHLEQDFAAQLQSVAHRQLKEEKQFRDTRKAGAGFDSGIKSEDTMMGSRWYNVKVAGGTKPGKVYLSAQVGNDGIDLYGHDDESGRQRWILEPGKTELGEEEPAAWWRLRLLGGASRGRRLLGRAARGRLQLCERDDGSGRQRWRLEPGGGAGGNNNWVCLRPAKGDPGVGPAAQDEAEAHGKYLGAGPDGSVGLHDKDDGSGRQRWVLPEWPGLASGGATSSRQAAGASPRQAASKAKDDVVAIAIRSGAEAAVSLRDLSHEQMSRALGSNRNLGTAIDLVGAYLKNYEIDKADRVCARIEPLCRERGGVWLFKLLNFYTTVRMKQSRYEEALDMYKEYETLIGFSPKEAWELYDTVYRNYGWIYTSLHDYEKSLEYFEKAVEVKRSNGINPHWFDQWDLGKTHARLSLQRGQPQNLELALRLIEEGLEMHRRAEPQDVIMRCKMLNSAGECAAVRGDFCGDRRAAEGWHDKAIKLHRESVDLYMQVLGPLKPLTGWAMEDLAGAYQKRGLHEEAKPLLHRALKVECTKDIIKLSSMARLLDSVLNVHRATADRKGLAECQDAINTGLENLQRRQVDQAEAPSYAALLQKIVEVLLAHDMANWEGAIALLEEGLGYLRRGRAAAPSAPAEGPVLPSAADERERQLHIPKAGQQEMEVDIPALRSSMEYQLTLLKEGRYCQEQWHTEEALTLDQRVEPAAPATAAADVEFVDENIGSSPPAKAVLQPEQDGIPLQAEAAVVEAVPAGGVAPLPPWPTHFEVIDDFPMVD